MRWSLVMAAVGVTTFARANGLNGQEKPVTRLGIEGPRFTINGKPTFLLGISYYAGLGAPREALAQDLAELKKLGFNWVRVWATWSSFGGDVSAVDAQGRPRQPFLENLRHLVTECDRQGIVVDVTLTRGTDSTDGGRVVSQPGHAQAVETIVEALKPLPNWYLDLANERNIHDARHVSYEELAELRELVRKLDPARLVTASHGGDMSQDELRKYLVTANVDFVTPHRPRDPGSPDQTAAKTREYLHWMRELGRIVPIHYQEPFRRGYDARHWEPSADAFRTDLRQAIDGGAAGWCFHNGSQRGQPGERPRRSFDLRETRLFDQLDSEERKAVTLFAGVLGQLQRPG